MREHADEAVENLPIIQNTEQLSFRRARATHDPYHIASRLETFLLSRSMQDSPERCASSIRLISGVNLGVELSGHG